MKWSYIFIGLALIIVSVVLTSFLQKLFYPTDPNQIQTTCTVNNIILGSEDSEDRNYLYILSNYEHQRNTFPGVAKIPVVWVEDCVDYTIDRLCVFERLQIFNQGINTTCMVSLPNGLATPEASIHFPNTEHDFTTALIFGMVFVCLCIPCCFVLGLALVMAAVFRLKVPTNLKSANDHTL